MDIPQILKDHGIQGALVDNDGLVIYFTDGTVGRLPLPLIMEGRSLPPNEKVLFEQSLEILQQFMLGAKKILQAPKTKAGVGPGGTQWDVRLRDWDRLGLHAPWGRAMTIFKALGIRPTCEGVDLGPDLPTEQ